MASQTSGQVRQVSPRKCHCQAIEHKKPSTSFDVRGFPDVVLLLQLLYPCQPSPPPLLSGDAFLPSGKKRWCCSSPFFVDAFPSSVAWCCCLFSLCVVPLSKSAVPRPHLRWVVPLKFLFRCCGFLPLTPFGPHLTQASS